MFYSSQHDALIYDKPELISSFTDARLINGCHVAIPAHLGNLQILRRLNEPVIAPMDRDYDWPIQRGLTPLPHQKVMANFMTLHPRCFNLSDMGTMKTLASLWAADYIMSHYPPGECRFLIVATLSTLRSVWADAIFQNLLGRRTCVVLHGDAQKRQDLLAKPADFYIVNHDGIRVGAQVQRKVSMKGFAADLAKRADIRGCIVDEASAYRDPGTARHTVARHLLKPRDYLWLMTGTPTPNGPLDAYGMAKLVNGAYGETLTSYKGRVMVQFSQFKWVPRAGAHEEAKKLLSPAVRFAIEDCVELPECTMQLRDVELSAEQARAYKEFKKDLVLQVGGKAITAVNEAVLRMKLIQIACGAIYDQNHVAHLIDASPRIAVLKEVIEQCREKVIVFAPLTSVVNMLNLTLKDYPRAVVNGAVSQKERTEIFRAFQQDKNPRVLIADPVAMAHGLTLVAASTIVWYAPVDRTEVFLQANKRIDRPGQKNRMNIVQLAATPVEREIFKRLANNQSMQGVMLRLAEER